MLPGASRTIFFVISVKCKMFLGLLELHSLYSTHSAQRLISADAGSTVVDDLDDLDHDLSEVWTFFLLKVCTFIALSLTQMPSMPRRQRKSHPRARVRARERPRAQRANHV